MAPSSPAKKLIPVAFPPGRLRLADKSRAHGTARKEKHDRNNRRLPTWRRGIAGALPATLSPPLGDIQAQGARVREPIGIGLLPKRIYRHGLAFDKTHFRPRPCRNAASGARGARVAKVVPRKPITCVAGCCALAAVRPHRRRAAEQRNELAPSHSITSSARARKMAAQWMPSVSRGLQVDHQFY